MRHYLIALVLVAGCTPVSVGGNSKGINAAHCHDGVASRDETDVDCGGADCAGCALGQRCKQAGDCASGACESGICVGADAGIPCGGACNLANAVAQCVNGSCAIAGCNADFGDCDKNAANGCETHVSIDSKNCGACGMACAQGQACQAGRCAPAGFCGGRLDGTPCTLANATGVCKSNACVLDRCDAGYADCDADPNDGCEVATGSDAKNCGACGTACGQGQKCVGGVCQGDVNNCGGVACRLNNATAQCVNDKCVIASCNLGFADCNKDAQDGCEMNLASDSLNCGACGNACPKGEFCMAGFCQGNNCGGMPCNLPHANAQCVNNMCVLVACDLGFADCDKNTANGCEIDTTSSPLNCGACGVVCPMGRVCMNGICP